MKKDIATLNFDKLYNSDECGEDFYDKMFAAFCQDWAEAYASANPEEREEMVSDLFGKEVE